MDTSCFISTRTSLPGVVFVDSESALSSVTDIYGFDSDSSEGCEGIFANRPIVIVSKEIFVSDPVYYFEATTVSAQM